MIPIVGFKAPGDADGFAEHVRTQFPSVPLLDFQRKRQHEEFLAFTARRDSIPSWICRINAEDFEVSGTLFADADIRAAVKKFGGSVAGA
jgi:hypothetical protein